MDTALTFLYWMLGIFVALMTVAVIFTLTVLAQLGKQEKR